jgi:hypothetical protein
MVSKTAELDRRDQVTATTCWPSFPSREGKRGQHLLNRVHPTCTERQSLNKECGWKGGDSGGLAQWEQLGEREKKRKERKNLTLTGLLMEGVSHRSKCQPTKLGTVPLLTGQRLAFATIRPSRSSAWRVLDGSRGRLGTSRPRLSLSWPPSSRRCFLRNWLSVPGLRKPGGG